MISYDYRHLDNADSLEITPNGRKCGVTIRGYEQGVAAIDLCIFATPEQLRALATICETAANTFDPQPPMIESVEVEAVSHDD